MAFRDRVKCPECGAIDGKDVHAIGCNGGNKNTEYNKYREKEKAREQGRSVFSRQSRKQFDNERDDLDQKVDIKKLIDSLDFSEEPLEKAAMEQPSLFYEACKFRIQKMRKRVRAESNLDLVSAEKGIFLRKSGSKKTEAAIKERLAVSPKVNRAKKEREEAVVAEEYSKQLVECFRQRKDAIKIISEIRMAEGFGEMRVVREEMTNKKMRKLANDVRNRYRSSRDLDD